MKKILILIALSIVSTLYYNKVDNQITQEDVNFITDRFIKIKVSNPYEKTYQQQLQLIKSIQHSVFVVARPMVGIEKGKPREPKDLYLKKTGLCFDRSRVIEKILRYYGFKTRHIALYSTKETNSTFKSLITPGIASHAFTEVFTNKGWLVVDSNSEWLSLDRQDNPISVEGIKDNKESVKNKLKNKLPSFVYEDDFFIIYGLYSRHGMYYPPYNIIPDINYSEFIDNFI